MTLANLRNLLSGDLDDETQLTAQSLGMSVEQLQRQEDAAAKAEYLSLRGQDATAGTAAEESGGLDLDLDLDLSASGASQQLAMTNIFESRDSGELGPARLSAKVQRQEGRLRAKRDGWDSELYYPQIVRAPVTNHGPDPSESYQDRLLRFSKVSAGVTMHPFCQDRQRNDAKDMESDLNRDMPTRHHP